MSIMLSWNYHTVHNNKPKCHQQWQWFEFRLCILFVQSNMHNAYTPCHWQYKIATTLNGVAELLGPINWGRAHRYVGVGQAICAKWATSGEVVSTATSLSQTAGRNSQNPAKGFEKNIADHKPCLYCKDSLQGLGSCTNIAGLLPLQERSR